MTITDVLYSEVGDECALCRTRGCLTIHHIDEDHENNAYDNQLILCQTCHDGYHRANDPSREKIRERKLHLMLRTLTAYGVSALKVAARNGFGVVSFPFLLWHLVELGYMSKEEMQMGYGEVEATARFAATDGGKRFVREWL